MWGLSDNPPLPTGQLEIAFLQPVPLWIDLSAPIRFGLPYGLQCAPSYCLPAWVGMAGRPSSNAGGNALGLTGGKCFEPDRWEVPWACLMVFRLWVLSGRSRQVGKLPAWHPEGLTLSCWFRVVRKVDHPLFCLSLLFPFIRYSLSVPFIGCDGNKFVFRVFGLVVGVVGFLALWRCLRAFIASLMCSRLSCFVLYPSASFLPSFLRWLDLLRVFYPCFFQPLRLYCLSLTLKDTFFL